MARKRMIDPDFWSDEKLGKCKRDERLFFMGLISNADDEGYGRANVKLLKSTIFPYDDDIKAKDIEQMICNLKGFVYVYVIDGQEFYYLPRFLKHQVINKPTLSKLPKFPENNEEILLPEYYGNITEPLPPNRIEKNRKEKKIIYGEFVSLTENEYKKLIDKYGENGAGKIIEILDNYKGSSGKKYDSDYRAILNWVVKRYEEEKAKEPKQSNNRLTGTARQMELNRLMVEEGMSYDDATAFLGN